MRGTVRFFASLREAAGQPQIEWELAEGATVSALIASLRDTMPDLASRLGQAWIAVNRRYVPPDTELRDGDEVALFPPVSGG